MGASFIDSLDSIHKKLTPNAVAMQIPIGLEGNHEGVVDLLAMKALYFKGQNGEIMEEAEIPANMLEEAKEWRAKMLEKIVAEDEVLMEKYLEGKEITIAEIKPVLRKATIANRLVPVYTGSALKNKGVQPVLDAVCDYLPCPLDIPAVKAIDLKTEQEVERKTDDNEPLAALAFKVATDPYVGSLVYVRVYSGILKKGTYVYNSSADEKQRIGRLVRMMANDRQEIEELPAGDIGAVVGIDAKTAQTLCDEANAVLLEKVEFPEPVIQAKIEAKTKEDQEKMSVALHKLTSEDPTFSVKKDVETGETIISGMGELHLEIMVDRMRREFKVNLDSGRPQVAYRETIRTATEGECKYVRQSGGKGQYGHVKIKLVPLERGKGFEFVDEIKGGVIPKEYIKPIEQGIRESLDKGVLAGYPITDVQVTLYDGSYHEVDSSESAFKIAASMAFKDGCKNASPVLLEPIMKVDITMPTEYFGDVIGDVNSRRGRIEDTQDSLNLKKINALVPLANMFGYMTTLRSITQGRGTFIMQFDHYEEVPSNIAKEIQEARN
jgi:elongation factor G